MTHGAMAHATPAHGAMAGAMAHATPAHGAMAHGAMAHSAMSHSDAMAHASPKP